MNFVKKNRPNNLNRDPEVQSSIERKRCLNRANKIFQLLQQDQAKDFLDRIEDKVNKYDTDKYTFMLESDRTEAS